MFKRLFPFMAAACLSAIPGAAVHAAPPTGNFTLTFEDNFDGTVLDGSIWRLGSHDGSLAGFSSNSSGAAINSGNVTVANGALKLTAKNEPGLHNGSLRNQTSGEISTFSTVFQNGQQQGFRQTYGYMEARIKYDNAVGLWPAFWTMPDRGIYGTQHSGDTNRGYHRGFLKFDLSGTSLGPITSAVVRLKVKNIQDITPSTNKNNTMIFEVAAADNGWTETGITWNNMPAFDQRFLDQKWDNRTIGSDVSLNVAGSVAGRYASGNRVFSFCLADTQLKTNFVDYYAREATTAAYRPVLIINGTHEFTAIADSQVSAGAYANNNYGTAEYFRVRDDYGNGSLTTVDSSGGRGMEIDIMESLAVWGNKETTHVLHWDGYVNGTSVNSTSWGHVPVADTTAYNTYGVYWEEGLIEFYINGVKTATFDDPRAPNVPAYLILSLQTGGWDGNSVGASIHNKSMEVDWVRVWSGTKSTSPAAATTLAGNGEVSFGTDSATYGGSGNAGAKVSVTDSGDAFTIARNGWAKFPLNYTVTPNTMLEFTVDSSVAGQILAVGLDENDVTDDVNRLFQLAGSQTWYGAWQDANDYPVKSGPLTYTINVGGYYTGAMASLAISAANTANSKNHARFTDVRVYEGTGGGGPGAGAISIGSPNAGVAATDWRGGSGYIMYSAANTATRFNAFAGNADHLIAVYYSGGQWYADRNYGQVAFTPAPTDILLASVTFGSSATVTSLEGQAGTEHGIEYGYATGNLTFTANAWGLTTDNAAGDFGVSGSSFTPNGVATSIGALNQGVVGTDWRGGSGFLMYSAQSVYTRFNAFAGNADHVIAVYYSGGQWYADRNYGQVAFTPVATDVLLAQVTFGTSATVSSLEGVNAVENGIAKGYSTGNLTYQANVWVGGGENPAGEFGVSGTSFTPW